MNENCPVRQLRELSAGLRFGPFAFRKNYRSTPNGYVEKVLLVNRDGFEKRVEIDADAKNWRMHTVTRIDYGKEFSPTAVMTENYLLFLRTAERSADGLAVFKEDGCL